MTDDLAKRLVDWDEYDEGKLNDMREEAKARIEALTAQLESTLKDRAQIIAERDRTYALMLARAEKAEADNARLKAILSEMGRIDE